MIDLMGQEQLSKGMSALMQKKLTQRALTQRRSTKVQNIEKLNFDLANQEWTPDSIDEVDDHSISDDED